MKLRAYLLMTFVVAVWGSTFVLIKGALADATPAAFNLIRMTLAFALLAIAYHRHWRTIRRTHIAAGALVGLCLAAGYQFQTIGLVRTTPSKSAFITGLVVVLVPLFSIAPALRPARRTRTPLECLPRRRSRLPRHPASSPRRRSSASSSTLSALLPDLSSINLGDVLTFGCAIGIRLPLHRSRTRLAAHSLSAPRHPSSRILRPLHGRQPSLHRTSPTSTSLLASSPRWSSPPPSPPPPPSPFKAGPSPSCPPPTPRCC